MSPPINLLRNPWIPVRRASGRTAIIRPADLTSDPDDPVVDVVPPRADLRVGLYEFLIGLLATACPPDDGGKWHAAWEEPPTPEQLADAFAALAPAFDLDGPGPRFLQEFESLSGDTLLPEALFLDAPGANTLKLNKDFFVKRARTAILSRGAAASALFTLNAFASEGGVGYRTSVRGGGPLTTLADPGPRIAGGPRTLWSRIWANVPAGSRPGAKDHPAIFPWLRPTRVSHGGVATTPEDTHPLQAFWGMPRRIRLVFEANPEGRPCDLTGLVDDVVVTGVVAQNYGINYMAWRHPLTPYYRLKPGDIETLAVHAPDGRIGFRHWLGMTYRNSNDTSLPAGAVTEFLNVRAEDIEPTARDGARVFAAGYALDNAKAVSFAEADMPLHATVDPGLRTHIAGLAGRAVESTRHVEGLLGASVKRALYRPDAKVDGTLIASVKESLWDGLEGRFHPWLDEAVTALTAAVPEEALLPAHLRWLKTLRHTALTLFDDTAPLRGLDVADVKAVVEARRSLSLSLAGYGPAGQKLYQAIAVPPPEAKNKARKTKAREAAVGDGPARPKRGPKKDAAP